MVEVETVWRLCYILVAALEYVISIAGDTSVKSPTVM